MTKILEFLKGLIDPDGPIGEFFSPSDVYKSRVGLPIEAPHNQRVQLETSAAVERALAPERFVAAAEANPPKERVRVLSAFIEEEWSPVYATQKTETNIEAIFANANRLVGWKVVQRARNPYCDCTSARFSRNADGEFRHEQCGRARKHLSDEEFCEIVDQVKIQASDEFYNGLYETIPGGTEPVRDLETGEILRGQPVYDAEGKLVHDGIIRGTYIRGGRAEWKQKTKGMVLWDEGVVRERAKAYAEEQQAPIDFVREALERTAHEVLPMRGVVRPSPRYDRFSRPM